jgi:hypothetical protein
MLVGERKEVVMRTILLAILMAAVLAATAFAQAGPGKKDPEKKAKADTTKVETAKPDTTKVETAKPDTAKAEKPAPPPEKKPPAATAPISQKATAQVTPSSHVKRAILCERVKHREPVGAFTGITTAADTVCFFTEIVGLAGATITHRWTHGDTVRAEVPIPIGGPSWRVYSRKAIRSDWTGAWTVEVVGADGAVLALQPFVYEPDGGDEAE